MGSTVTFCFFGMLVSTALSLSMPGSPASAMRRCTRWSCKVPLPNAWCRNVRTWYPNGKGCRPACRSCADGRVENMVCPPDVPTIGPGLSPDWRPEREDICRSDSQCTVNEKCCKMGRWLVCQKAIDKRPHFGFCPHLVNAFCIADFGGCTYDGECQSNQKCCFNEVCSQRQCVQSVGFDRIVNPSVGPPTGPTAGPPTGPTVGPPTGPTAGPPTGPTFGPTGGDPTGPTFGPTGGDPTGPTFGPTGGDPTGAPDFDTTSVTESTSSTTTVQS